MCSLTSDQHIAEPLADNARMQEIRDRYASNLDASTGYLLQRVRRQRVEEFNGTLCPLLRDIESAATGDIFTAIPKRKRVSCLSGLPLFDSQLTRIS